MADLSIYATTFNCGRKFPETNFFAGNLFKALTTNLPPDLIVLSLQEIAPLGYSFLGGSLLAPYFSRFEDVIHVAADMEFGPEVQYESLMVRNVGLTGIMLFVRQEVARKVRWMRTAGVGVGVAETGNKGAVGVRLALEGDGEGEDVLLTFVAAHLAPMEGGWERRNQDWRSICEGLVFEKDSQSTSPTPSQADKGSEDSEGEENAPLLTSDPSAADTSRREHTLFSPATHLFFLGDLNYRTSNTPPSSDTHQTWPELHYSPDHQHHYTQLLARDQLTRERKANRTLHNLTEAEINFEPTYKYSSAAQKNAAQMIDFYQNTPEEEEEEVSAETSEAENHKHVDQFDLWAKHRYPSWCDRVLYLSAAEPKVHAYDALPIQPTSDHRPVALSCSVPFAPVKAEVKAPFAVKSNWRERRAAARKLELIVGAAMYLGWTWEGEMLVLGSVVGVVGGWLVLRGLVGA